MKAGKLFILTGLATLLSITTRADTSLTAYGTYWDADTSGQGAGLRLKKTILAFGAAELRGGYVNFDNAEVDMVPLDVSINARLPFMFSPYAGIGVGYYFLDSDLADLENRTGYLAQFGVEATFFKVGVMAEVRYHDIEGTALDGPSFNAGVLFKW